MMPTDENLAEAFHAMIRAARDASTYHLDRVQEKLKEAVFDAEFQLGNRFVLTVPREAMRAGIIAFMKHCAREIEGD